MFNVQLKDQDQKIFTMKHMKLMKVKKQP